mgnify:CR=1 FL=1|tara:strand:- start:144 stop:584 length:441 start_codon:yes stop_codon:yes gene_type:complete
MLYNSETSVLGNQQADDYTMFNNNESGLADKVVATLESYELGAPGFRDIPYPKTLFNHSERDRVVSQFKVGDIGECKLFKNYYQKRNGNSYGSFIFRVKEVRLLTASEKAMRVQNGENLRSSHIVYEVLEWDKDLYYNLKYGINNN